MLVNHLADGVTTDIASEFMYAPPEELRILYQENPLGYHDAVFKFLMIVGMSHAVLLPKGRMKTGYSDRLRNVLRHHDKLDHLRDDAFQSEADAQVWLRENWHAINEAIQTKSDLFQAVAGLLRREYRVAFCSPPPDYNIGHYYPSVHALRVTEPLRTLLQGRLRDLVALAPTAGPRLTAEEIGNWLDAALSAHYRNFRRNWLAASFDYTPSFTRAAAGLVANSTQSAEGELVTVRRAIVLDMMKKVRRREDLIERAIEWTRSEEGTEVLDGYAHLRAMFDLADESERRRHKEEMEKILNRPVSRVTDAILGVVSGIKRLIGGEVPEGTPALIGSPSLRWLWNIRGPGAQAAVTGAIESLLQH